MGWNPLTKAILGMFPSYFNLFSLLPSEYVTKIKWKGGHWETLMNSSLSLKKGSWTTINKRIYPGTAYARFDPPYKVGREIIPF